MADLWHYGCDELETLTGLADSDGNYLNAATVTYAIKTVANSLGGGAAVTGGTGSYAYVAASNGNYKVTIESTVTGTLVVGTEYILEVTIVSGAFNDLRYLSRRVVRRGDE